MSAGFGRLSQDATFSSHDRQSLYYRHWPVLAGTCKGAIVLFHRGHEHSARLAHVVDELNLPGYAFFAWDARGHGRSPGPRGFGPDVPVYVRDVQAFIDHLGAAHGVAPRDVFVVASGSAAVLVSAWLVERSPALRGVALASPAFLPRVPAAAVRALIRLLQWLRGPFLMRGDVAARLLTQDPQRIASYERDRLISPLVATALLLGLRTASRHVLAAAPGITVPAQLLISGADRVTRVQPQREFFARLGSAVKEVHELPGLQHDALGERDRCHALAPLRAFIERVFAEPPSANLPD